MFIRLLQTIFIALLLTFFNMTADGQISIVPLQYNSIVANANSEKNLKRNAKRLESLPFVDDFSNVGPFPNPALWQDNYVFVNATLAIDPPSIGVATFDGLDNTGSPYGTDGAGDTLTSVPIDLEVITPNNLFLSFFIQQKGFGDKPEFNDEFILEFKNDMDRWVIMREFNGTDQGTLPSESVDFFFETVEISSQQFLHNDFQFRFRNISSGDGFVDLWHLDLVRLINNQQPALTYQDQAFVFPTQSILNRYSAMPTKHFLSNTNSHLRDVFTFNIINHFDAGVGIGGEGSVMSITELNSGQEVVSPQQYLLDNININADTSIFIETFRLLEIESSLFEEDDNLSFENLFVINPEQNNNGPGLIENNFLRRVTDVSDYFAYDDGTAEVGIQAQGPGTQIAVEFETSVMDTLGAIQLHFPHILNDVSSQNFNLKVWLESLDSEPIFVGQLLNTIYPDSFVDTIQGFTTYRLEDTFTGELQPVIIPANTTFFIGWEQVSVEFEDAIPVGFDLSTTNVGLYQHFMTSQSDWVTFESEGVEGAVMIRPLMGVQNAISTSVENKEEQEFILYPNPVTSEVRVKSFDRENINAQIAVWDIQGRIVHTQNYQDQESIDLHFLPSGIYFITLTDVNGVVLFREKLIKQDS